MRSPVRSIDSRGHYLHTCGLLHAKLAALDPQARSPGRLFLTSTCRLEASFEVTLLNAFVGGVQEMAEEASASRYLFMALVGSSDTRWGHGEVEARRRPSQDLPTILKMLASMVCGQEAAHLRRLLRWADHKGSDVLRDGCLLQGSAQIAPYPAAAWAWRCVQHHKWGASHRINVLAVSRCHQRGGGLPLLPHFRQSSCGCDCSQGTFLIPQPQPCARTKTVNHQKKIPPRSKTATA